MALTDTKIKTSKYEGKQFKLTDEKGMYLLVNSSGKYFRMDYRYASKRKTLALGVYPETSLKDARDKRDEARRLLANGIDPSDIKKTQKLSFYEDSENSFYKVASEWFVKFKTKWTPLHADKKWSFLEKDVFPYFGDKPIKNITAKDLLILLTKIQDRGAIDIAHRIKGICGEVFRYGIVTGRCERDPSQDLRGALIPKRNNHMACITEKKELKGLLNALDSYEGEPVTKLALKLLPYVFVRPGELRQAEWSELDLDNKIWKIPAGKMKMRTPHIIPLSRQVIEIFQEIKPLTGHWKYVFPSVLSKERAMSNNTMTAALRRMGFTKEEVTAHGFRGTASTLLHENGWNSEFIELQLAHQERNKVKAAYNHAKHLDERTKMMQWWADYLDRIKNT
jgi:integrase